MEARDKGVIFFIEIFIKPFVPLTRLDELEPVTAVELCCSGTECLAYYGRCCCYTVEKFVGTNASG